MPPKRKASTSPPPASADIFRSAPISDRLSTFVAVYSSTVSAKALQRESEFATASHRVAAWRTVSRQRAISATSLPPRQIFDTGHDDDGEQYAGKRLEKLLDTMKVEGAVVVARWYGGVMLGPVRFTHIENCARDAIIKSRESELSGLKKPKNEEVDENLLKEKLQSVLAQRDQSISTLRILLAEKKGGDSAATPASSPARPMSYTTMPLPALTRLEKARDATIAWLLQEIDKAEKSAAAVERVSNETEEDTSQQDTSSQSIKVQESFYLEAEK